MTVGRTRSIALLGLDGALVDVESELSNGNPAFKMIGLPDSALRESEQRVRVAISNSGLEWPAVRITVALSPADLPKQGSGFDVATAVAILATSGQISQESAMSAVHLGELALDGRLRPLRGVLPAVYAAQRAGAETVVVPRANADEASLVPGIRVIGAASLRDIAIHHGADLEAVPVEPLLQTEPPGGRRDARTTGDLADVIGSEEPIHALIVAAAGGHHLSMVGPPGAGKTMLASRLPGILPQLDEAEAIEVTSLRSLCGLPVGAELSSVPPFEAPHHTSTAGAIVGGGSGRVIRPGAAVRATNGVLFLDEAPEFARDALESLRQPLETGRVSIERAGATARFPARFQLILAANPCRCGQYGVKGGSCTCAPGDRDRYARKLSGPLLDRIDIQLRVSRISAAQLRMAAEGERITTAHARAMVEQARERTRRRLRGTGWTANAQVPGSYLRDELALDPAATRTLDRAFELGALTMRGYDRVLRVAWTLADLDGIARPGVEEIGRALTLRTRG